MLEFKVNVLESEYKIVFGLRSELPDLKPEHSGETHFFKKLILVCTEFGEEYTAEEKSRVLKNIVLHELAHAFLYESGFDELADDERLVSWIEIMIPKLMRKNDEVLRMFVDHDTTGLLNLAPCNLAN